METIITSSIQPAVSFIDFFREYVNRYTKKDTRVMRQALRRYEKFVSSHNISESIPTNTTIRRFVDYLMDKSTGYGASSTFARFKKVIRYAYKTGILDKNPCDGIRCAGSGDCLVKDILSSEEICRMISTHYEHENAEIRKAFIFCLYTGIRFCDVKALEGSNIDYQNMFVRFRQKKTMGSSKNCIVHIPLRHDIISLIGTDCRHKRTLFILPSHTTCLKHLRRWTCAAGIRKHITWHCARHSFATNILCNGTNIRIVAELLGHSGLKYVEKYTRVIDRLKIEAVSSLPPIRI